MLAILRQYIVSLFDLERFVHQCDGCGEICLTVAIDSSPCRCGRQDLLKLLQK